MDDYPIKELKCPYTAQVLGFFYDIWTENNILIEEFFKIKSYQGGYGSRKCQIEEK